MGRAVGVRVSGERSAVGAGHARPARVRQTGACGKAARRGQDPSLQDDDNGCFVGSGLDRSAGCVRQTAACQKAAGRIYAAPTNLPGGSVGGGVLDAPRRCTANGCLPEGRGPGMPGPYKATKTGTPALPGRCPCFLCDFYTFLNPTLCINRTNAA